MERVLLGSILHMEKGKKPIKQIKKPQNGFLPYVDIKAFEKGIVDNYATVEKSLLCEDGDLLIVCDGSRSGLTGKAIKGVVGSTLAKISADGLSTDYLRYFIQSIYTLLNTQKKGTGTPHLNTEIMRNAEIAVPALLEQERIVARIEELLSQLDNGVETLKKSKQQLAVYRQAVLKEAFAGLNNSGKKSLSEVCSKVVDCPHSTPQWVNQGELCLRTTNFKRGYLDLSERNYVSPETFNKRNSRLKPEPGDVLYSREGAILGIACIIPDNLSVCLGQRMMLLRTNELMSNKYLMYYLNSPYVTTFIASITGGSASPHVNVGDIKELKIPVPPLNDQLTLVHIADNCLSICDSIEQTIDTALWQAETMRQSILKKAFEEEI